MATNRKYEDGRFLYVDAGSAVESGEIVSINNLTGVAMYDADSSNNVVIDTAGVYSLSVKAHDGSSNSKVSIGQVLYADETNNRLDKDSSNPIFGIALEEVVAGATSTIQVLQAKGNLTNLVNDSVSTGNMDPLYMKVATETLASGGTTDQAFSFQNPESGAIIIHKVVMDVTAAAGSSGSLMDIGTADDATTTGDDVIDGVDINSVHVVDNIDDQGTNGGATVKLDANGGTTDYVNGTINTAAANSLAGYVYIYYTKVQ